VEARRYVGSRIKRKEDPRFITGRGRYVDDIQMPGMLYAAFLRASYAHARIKSIDTSKAEKIPGVVGVYTGDYFKGKVAPLTTAWALTGADLKPIKWPVVAYDKVRFTGDIVAVVVAEDPYVAYD
jgi:carbon-monoxide dehydrogenase large subunit